MTGKIVIVGAGPIGLATAMLLSRDGYEITVLEKDVQTPPATGLEAWEHWERSGVAQFRQAHVSPCLPRSWAAQESARRWRPMSEWSRHGCLDPPVPNWSPSCNEPVPIN